MNIPVKSFSQLDSHVQAQVVVNIIIRRAIIQVNAECGTAVHTSREMHPVVMDRDRVDYIQLAVRLLCRAVVSSGVKSAQRPESVTSPGVKHSMVICLSLHIKDIIVCNLMTAKCSVSDVHACSRSFMQSVVQDLDLISHGQRHMAGLLFPDAHVLDMVIGDNSLSRIMLLRRSGSRVIDRCLVDIVLFCLRVQRIRILPERRFPARIREARCQDSG